MRLVLFLSAALAIVLIGQATAQVGISSFFPGPGSPALISGGGCGTGVIDASAGCPIPMLGM
jgi:hypothetical protein